MKRNLILMIALAIFAVIIILISLFVILQGPEELTFVAQSNSMNPGIKWGDVLIYEKIQNKGDIITWKAGNATKDYEKFGDYGDVIIYRPYGDSNSDEIVHRAMCWIQFHDEYGTYTVPEYGHTNVTSITISELGLSGYKPEHSGYITKGDWNAVCDQTSLSLCIEPIKVEWIIGKVTGIK